MGLGILWPQSHQHNQMDRFLVCGKNYRVVRDALGKAIIECQADGIAAALKVKPFLLISYIPDDFFFPPSFVYLSSINKAFLLTIDVFKLSKAQIFTCVLLFTSCAYQMTSRSCIGWSIGAEFQSATCCIRNIDSANK